jgi:hypothetical protein
VTTDDQVVALLGRANPVPSLDLLDPIEPVDLDRLEDATERTREMTTAENDVVRRSTPFRSRLVPILAALGAVLVSAPLLFNGMASIDDSPGLVADSYMSARAEHDWEGIKALFDEEIPERSIEVMVDRDSWDYQRAVGLTYRNLGCERISSGSRGSLVECEMQIDTRVSRLLGLEPAQGLISILVGDGQIQRVSVAIPDDPTARPNLGLIVALDEAVVVFEGWITENHPEAEDIMYDPARSGPVLNPESIALWEQYTDEFVAEMEAGG